MMTRAKASIPYFLLLMAVKMTAQNTEFNHFYVTLDHETYAAIEANAFLKNEFASFEKRTTVRRDTTYTGIYFYGSNTYFEFFDASKEKRAVGESGIAFGVDTEDSLPKVAGAKRDLVTREWNGRQVPWFQRLAPGIEIAPGIASWVMAYEPSFLKEWRPELVEGEGVTRAAVLKRYKRALASNPAKPMLDDVVGLTIALSRDENEGFLRWQRQLGSRFEIVLVPAEGGERGIRSVRFRLRRSPPVSMLMMFGPRSTLTLNSDGTATWNF